ncbi:MAG: flagellar biosynthetic protein FliO [Planctomycetaceae bacterium]|jgi:flagellar biogenesis protein FliO|nr:flagellar biosynthetic protein FliO [Planctomycetaceae bacterium]
MPVLRILTLLIITAIITVIWAIGGVAYLVAEEPDRPFIDRPSASFVQGNAQNFTQSATHSPTPTSAPTPPKSSEQLRYVRDALAATSVVSHVSQNTSPPQSTRQPVEQPAEQPIQPPLRLPMQTANTHKYKLPPIQQVTAIEPEQSPNKLTYNKQIETTEPREPMDMAVNTIVETPNETPNETTTATTAENFSDQLLDKTIGSGKTENGKKLMNRPKISSAVTPLISVLGSLLIVIGVFFILVLFLKKVSPKGNRLLPKEAFENLGRVVLTQKIQLHLLRLGNRLILVSITPDGVSPITEITDSDEVVPLLGLCRQLDSHSSTEFFRKTLSSFSTGGTEGGYFGADVAKVNKVNIDSRKNSLRNNKSRQSTAVDFYSEPDESLAEILAKGGQHG